MLIVQNQHIHHSYCDIHSSSFYHKPVQHSMMTITIIFSPHCLNNTSQEKSCHIAELKTYFLEFHGNNLLRFHMINQPWYGSSGGKYQTGNKPEILPFMAQYSDTYIQAWQHIHICKLVYLMACSLSVLTPSLKPKLTYCQLDHQKTISGIFQSKCND